MDDNSNKLVKIILPALGILVIVILIILLVLLIYKNNDKNYKTAMSDIEGEQLVRSEEQIQETGNEKIYKKNDLVIISADLMKGGEESNEEEQRVEDSLQENEAIDGTGEDGGGTMAEYTDSIKTEEKESLDNLNEVPTIVYDNDEVGDIEYLDDAEDIQETQTESSLDVKLKLIEIRNFLVTTVLNSGFENVIRYATDQKDQSGKSVNINLVLDKLRVVIDTKNGYSKYLKRLGSEKFEVLLGMWNKTSEEIDRIYNEIKSINTNEKEKFNIDISTLKQMIQEFISYVDEFII